VEPALQAGGERSYREVMREAMRELGAQEADEDALADALPSWQPFPEVRQALEHARERGWKLAILSNTDRDFIEASIERIGVAFDLAIVASEIGSYKPAHRHWLRFEEEVDAQRDRHVHVAQSHVHDVLPATELGLRTIWINRYGELHEPAPTRELPDLSRLPETLDELVPA
jgi:2-haloacid dehalogenase